MSGDRDVSEVILAAWASLLRKKHVPNPEAVARDQLGIARAHGVRFAVPAHWRDPNADHRRLPEPGDYEAGLAAALAALGKGICRACGDRVDLDNGLIAAHQVSDDPPHPPFHPCPGSRRPPRTAPQPTDEQDPQDV